MKFKTEKWVSTQNQSEIHYFVGENTYVFGYNPKFFTKKQVQSFLKGLKSRRTSLPRNPKS